MGDPAGIGPEVVLKALADPAVLDVCRPVVFGDAALLREAARRLGLPAHWRVLTSAGQIRRNARTVQLVHLPPQPPTPNTEHPLPPSPRPLTPNPQPPLPPSSQPRTPNTEHRTPLFPGAPLDVLFSARPTRQGGAASLRAIEAAAQAAREGLVAALATAPIHKQAIAMAGSPFAGHTDLLASFFGARRVVMMLAGGPLRVALVTHHIRLADVPDALSTESIVATALLTDESLRRDFAIPAPRLAIAGLNPHASDGSRFGDEELRTIEPAVVELHQAGLNARGPLPPDTCFLRAARGEFDAVIAMYHDQGLIPLKLLAFEDAVNLTLGLPIIRTSADHGTAYDIAGRGVASPRSMIAALLLAARMARSRRHP